MTSRCASPILTRRQVLAALAAGAATFPFARPRAVRAGDAPSLDHHDLTYYLAPGGERKPVRTLDDWAVRRQQILDGMQQVMGPFPGPDKKVPLDMQTVSEVKLDGGLLRRTISFQTETAATEPDLPAASRRVHAHLFIPARSDKADARGRMPAILALQQTSSHGADEPAGLAGPADMHYALELGQRGYVVLTPDYPSFQRHRWDFDKDHYASGTMKAIWDNVCAVNLLQSLPMVDGQRLGCLGHSLGGHNAMFTAAFEPRLRAIVSNSGFSSFRKDDVPSWTGPRYMPLIASRFGNDAARLPFDFPEIVASFAPRAFLAIAPTRDSDFDPAGVRDCIAAARPIYALYGHPERLQAEYPEAAHSFPQTSRMRAYAFLDAQLARPAQD